MSQEKTTSFLKVASPFVKACLNTMGEQFDLNLTPERPSWESKNENEHSSEVGALIELHAEGFEGTLFLGFNEEILLGVYNEVFEEERTSVDDEVADLAKEMLNIIYGHGKTQLNKHNNFNFGEQRPEILRGEKIAERHAQQECRVVIPLQSQHGTLRLEIYKNDQFLSKESA